MKNEKKTVNKSTKLKGKSHNFSKINKIEIERNETKRNATEIEKKYEASNGIENMYVLVHCVQ